MINTQETYGRLLILTDLGMVRVLNFKDAGDDPRSRAHLAELSVDELGPPRGALTTDGPGKFNRGSAAGGGEAMSHAETKLDIEVEKRAIAQVAKEICEVVSNTRCGSFTLAAPQEHLKRLESEMDASCREKLGDSLGADLTKASLKDLEKRFL
ncbi:host attachment protein [Luteolibacter sp. AS25]|uniref:host attachment protein n=1 Tax=Luteolibacter sp. AS25 TaxID=3135776 RepID=UPI00398B0F18